MDQLELSATRLGELDQRVINAKKDMEAIKNAQFIGTDSIRFYQNDTGNPYDWTGTLPESPQAPYVGTKVLVIEAVARTQPVLFADLILEYYVNDMGNLHTVIDYIHEIYTNVDYFYSDDFGVPVEPTETHIARWGISLNGGDADAIAPPPNTVFAKFYVVANDIVDITVTEVN